MSGLKINEEKTKALWIGSKNNSQIKLCQEYNLDWNQQPLNILDVNFSSEVFNIWDLNSIELVKKTENLIQHWTKRKLKLPGRVTIIKSLALAKFIHLFIYLPNPPDDLVKNIEKRFDKFLWHAGPDRISRKIIIKDLENGGLRMVQISTFIKALKVTWLRRIIINSRNTIWSSLSNLNFSDLFFFWGWVFSTKYTEIKKILFRSILCKVRKNLLCT